MSWIAPAGASPSQLPVMSSLERLVEVRNAQSVTIQGLQLHHVTYHGLDDQMNFINSAMYVISSSHITIVDCAFSHTEMSGLFLSGGSNILVDRNVFTDIGYHGILKIGSMDDGNVSITNNYIDGVGITRQWSTFGIFAQGSLDVLIGNNEVTRTSGGGIHVVSESFRKGSKHLSRLECPLFAKC